MSGAALKQAIDRLIADEAVGAARARLAELWRQEPDVSVAGFVVSRYGRLGNRARLVSSRVAILRSFTVEPAMPLLRAAALVDGIDLNVQVGGFNTYAQEILDPGSGLYTFAPDVVILAVQTRDVAPELWQGTAALPPEEVNGAVDRVVQGFRGWVEDFRGRSEAHLILHTLEVPVLPSAGILDAQAEEGQVAGIQRVNRELRRLAGEHVGVYVLDYDGLVARFGRVRWHDATKWLTMRMPMTAEALLPLAREWLRFLHPLTGKVCKALVTDLDNTLWGGVVGEDGLAGIRLGPDYPAAAYQALQRVMLDLHHRGVLLAVASKNNQEDALEALRNHSAMLLRPEHFAALRINWNDKAQGLREIAAELSIGLDSIAFLDDNPVERERVRSELAEVTVLDLPEDPMGYADALRNSPVFERLVLSSEDRERGRYYAEQRQRTELKDSVTSLEDYYYSLQQVVTVAPAQPETLPRVAQLTQKTNQFNLTTRRYTEQQIREMNMRPLWGIYRVHVRDRFGDNGLVGVVITRDAGEVCEIDTFLLSCRVIGRTVEKAVLAFLAEDARGRGCRELRGWFLPTKKNAPARDFYPANGFGLLKEEDAGSLWSLDLTRAAPPCPAWIILLTFEREYA